MSGASEKSPQEKVQNEGISQEQMERMKRYEEARKKRIGELTKVTDFLIGTVGLRTHKGLFQREKSLEYFRGVNFHVAVLAHKEKILAMVPTFKEEGIINKLDSLEESIKLG